MLQSMKILLEELLSKSFNDISNAEQDVDAILILTLPDKTFGIFVSKDQTKLYGLMVHHQPRAVIKSMITSKDKNSLTPLALVEILKSLEEQLASIVELTNLPIQSPIPN